MTGPAVPGTEDEVAVLREHAEGSAAVAALVADGFDDWIVERLDTAGPAGMSLADIQLAVFRRYGRMVGEIFLEEPCNRLVLAGRIAAGPAWLRFRRRDNQTPAADGAAGDERQGT